MDALQSNITGACPLAFSGTSGVIFANAIAAVMTAHCTLVDDLRWPAATEHLNDDLSYDFIIVGGGTAGTLVANRLALHNPSWSLLLVEAGDDPGLDSEIPAFLFLNQNSDIDWNYKTFSDNATCLGFVNNSCTWSKGKALGGSSSINAMLYLRGHPEDYDHWEDSGNLGWGYNDLAVHFERLEQELDLKNYKYNENMWYHVIENAWKELNFNCNKKSDEALIGTKIAKLLTRNGRRLNTAKLFINEIPNLHVVKKSVVQRVLIDPSTKIATGIELRKGNSVVIQIQANKEVILSAGSIGTPQLLMLSGIGPKHHLKENNIETIVDLAVGKNLQDHITLPLLLKTNQNIQLVNDGIILYLLQYMLSKTGPISNLGVTDLMGFISTNISTNYPDIQFHHTYFTKNDRFMLKQYFQGLGYRNEIVNSIQQLNTNSDLLGIYPTLLHPKSRGEILLDSKDPFGKPLIKANYLNIHEDMETILKAIEFIHKLEKTETFKSLGIELVKLDIDDCISYPFDTKSYWECYIRHVATTIYHPVGTTKMGPENDASAVVDNYLQVYGVNQLRVIDASVMPTIPGVNTMGTTLAIAEKASMLIKTLYTNKDEL